MPMKEELGSGADETGKNLSAKHYVENICEQLQSR